MDQSSLGARARGLDVGQPVLVPRLTTVYSSTYLEPDGSYQAVYATTPVNYVDGAGHWAPIDNTLVDDPGGPYAVENAANTYDAQIPQDAGQTPVKFTSGSQWVTFQMDGLDGSPDVDGSEATFTQVPDASGVTYQATGVGLKESIEVDSAPEAATTYSFDVQTSNGVTPAVQQDGSVAFVDAGGDVVFTMPAAVMSDSAVPSPAVSTDVPYTVTALGGSGWQLTVSPDLSWLQDPSRVYPVTIDPTVTDHSAKRDCWMDQGSPSTSSCFGAQMHVGVDDSGNFDRGLLYFDLAKIPEDAAVTSADLALWLNTSATTHPGTSGNYSVQQPGRGWTNQAAWNTPDGSATWTGGNPDGVNYGTLSLDGSGTAGYVHWNGTGMATLVNDWTDGSITNNGIVLKQGEATTNVLQFISSDAPDSTHWPRLTITYYTPTRPQGSAAGQRDFYTYTSQKLEDRVTSKVNDGNGNLFVTANDVNIPGVAGQDFDLNRYYNSVDYQTADPSALGDGWSDSIGGSVRLSLSGSGSQASRALFYGKSGYITTFDVNASGGYVRAAPGLNAALVYDSTNNVYRLQWYDNSQYVFNTSGQLTSMRDAAGNAISYTYNGTGQLTQATDTTGHLITFGYDGAGMLSTVNVKKANGTLLMTETYGYTGGTPDLLASSEISYVNFSALGDEADSVNVGVLTTYHYDSNGRLREVDDPLTGAVVGHTQGQALTYTYNSGGQVATSTESANDGSLPSSVTTFTYSTIGSTGSCVGSHGAEGVNETDVDGPRTDVTDTTTYCSDTLARVVRTYSPLSVVRTQQFNDDSQTTQADGSGTESGAVSTYQYDDNDNATQATTPTGGNATMSYGDSSNPHRPTTYTDQAAAGSAATWNYTYDTDGFLTQAKSTGSGTNVRYRYCWGAQGSLQRLDPPDTSGNNQTSLQTGAPTGCGTASQGQDTLYSYNSSGLLQTVTPPSPQGQTSYTYDPLNRVLTETDGRGVTTTYTYDALDHVVGLAYSGSGSTSIGRSYDADGNRLSVTDPTGTTTWTFDAFNRQATQSAQSPAGSITYAYDKAGDVTTITNSNDPGPTTYTYNANDQVISANDLRQVAADKITIGYDAHGQRDEIDFPMADGHDLIEKYAYEDGGHLDCVFSYRANNAPTLDAKGCPDPTFSGLYTDHAYDYTGPGGIPTDTVYTMTQKDGQVTDYRYDDIDRVTEAKTQLGSNVLRDFTYTYDYRSNMTKSVVSGTTPHLNTGTFTKAFNNDNELCWYQTAASSNSCSTAPTGSSSFSYNGSGDMTAATGGTFGGLSLSYTLPDQTSSITPAGSSTAVPMTYQGATQDTRLTAGDTSMAYASTGLDEQQTTGTGANTQWFLRLPDGTLLADIAPQTRGSYQQNYYLVDAQQTVLATVDTTGTAIRYLDDPYGQQIRTWVDPNAGNSADDGSENALYGPPTTDNNPYRFQSGYLDTTTGTLKFGDRYYVPLLAAWTQVDPSPSRNLANPLLLNAYTFVRDSPMNFTDATGRFSWSSLFDGFEEYMGSMGLFDTAGLLAAVVGETGLEGAFALSAMLVVGGLEVVLVTAGIVLLAFAGYEVYEAFSD